MYYSQYLSSMKRVIQRVAISLELFYSVNSRTIDVCMFTQYV